MEFYQKIIFLIIINKKTSQKKIISISLVCSNKNIVKQALKYAESINIGVTETRNLVTTPPNILNPIIL